MRKLPTAIVFASLLTLSALSGPTFGADYEAAAAAYQAEDYASALPVFQELAAADNDDAMWYLGKMYANGWGVEQSDAESLKWFLKSAELGDPDSQWEMGMIHEYGTGVREDQDEAFDWYLKAAENNYVNAMNEVGYRYESGSGVRESLRNAAEWYTKGAEAGNLTSIVNLGVMRETGNGLDQDYAEAARLYGIAADEGDARGTAYLGELYANGYGVEQDLVMARRLYDTAAAAGSEYAVERLAEMGFEPGPPAAAPAQGDELFEMAAVFMRDEDYDTGMPIMLKIADELNHARAQALLGVLAENGLGMEQSFAEAAMWYRRGADNGNADARYGLAVLLFDGRDGVDADPDQAVELFRQAAAQGHAQAQAAMNQLGVE